ncbi:bacterial regulatory helix-turn-helix, lysR family protein [Janthinobacterium agaricidamnosum NBRC 102515 = DSM 9628]|uniref:Bacterial regulatory helix-turn-helix, lysR family protein n=2 Tax=Janthinobacterium agaricidamnosum TaxID=55508 RepID=W0V154_9BURK|nr:bacterial regulatory helix-turn-helix, lysR family protein [Janthinobacterium agaricidamnosum NBRC 102515 = DSM 9628]
MLQALHCFEAAARHQSYTHAARELSLTQSAVSRQISSLEAFLGVQLFQRTRHGVLLTPPGAAYARQIAARLDGLERDTLDAMARQGGGAALRLASVPTFATRWLMPRLSGLALEHPDITVHIDAFTRPFMFADTEYDAALYAGTPEQLAKWPGTRTALLMMEDIVPVASPRLLAGRAGWRPGEIAALPLLQQSTRPEAWRQWFDAMQVGAELALHGPRYELFSMLAMAAAQGLGVALLPRMLVEAELARGELAIVCDRPLRGQRAYYLITPEAVQEKAAVTQFRLWLQQQGMHNGGDVQRTADASK